MLKHEFCVSVKVHTKHPDKKHQHSSILIQPYILLLVSIFFTFVEELTSPLSMRHLDVQVTMVSGFVDGMHSEITSTVRDVSENMSNACFN